MTKGIKIALIALAGVGTAAAVYYLMNKSGSSTTGAPQTGPLPYVKVVTPTGGTVVIPNPDLIKKGNYVPPPQSELLKNLIANMK